VDAVTQVPPPTNEPVLGYAPGSPERATLEERLKELAAAEPVELTATIGDQTRMAGGPSFEVTMPSDHAHVLGRANAATQADAAAAIEAAQAAAPDWASTIGRRSSYGPRTCSPVPGGRP
jgi:1-pyrroline-5-carboxylate dehydrogenase